MNALTGTSTALFLYGIPFVGLAVWLHRRYGTKALIALWAIASAALALTNARRFIFVINPQSNNTGPGFIILALLYCWLNGVSFGAAAVAVHRAAGRGGPATLLHDFVMPLVAFAVGGVVAFGAAALLIVLVGASMAP